MREVRRLLPAENLLYFADSAHCPYGSKPTEAIRARAFAISKFLLSLEAKLIVVASNTTSTAVLEALRERYSVPVVGVEPAVKPAAAVSRNGKVGVLATGVTINSHRFSSLVERFGGGVEVLTQPCPGLVELVETGKHEGLEAKTLLHRFLDPILEYGCDTVVLGCTHYPFLKTMVQEIAGPGVTIIDTGESVANQVARVLAQRDLATPLAGPGDESFFSSGNPVTVEPVIRLLWGNPDLVVEHVDL